MSLTNRLKVTPLIERMSKPPVISMPYWSTTSRFIRVEKNFIEVVFVSDAIKSQANFLSCRVRKNKVQKPYVNISFVIRQDNGCRVVI